MATFATDTFTDTAGTALTSHTGETGATWTKPSAMPGADSVVSDANRVRPNQATSGLYQASGTPAAAEYDVQADIRCVSATTTGSMVGVAGRIANNGNDCYLVRYNEGAGAWQLYKIASGGFTALGTPFSDTFTAGQTKTLKLEIRDAAKKVYVDGVERISSADNAVTAAGKAGVWMEGVASNTSGFHLDNFSAADPGGGPAASPWYYYAQQAG